jgi:hypothetical protein
MGMGKRFGQFPRDDRGLFRRDLLLVDQPFQ